MRGDGPVSSRERVVNADPYDTFFSREITSIAGPYGNVECIYCSVDLEKAIRKAAQATMIDAAKAVPIKGIGELSLERAAALYARLDMFDAHKESVPKIPAPTPDPYFG